MIEIAGVGQCLLTTLPDGTGVVLNVATRRYVAVNATGVCVWQALEQGPRSADELAAAVSARFEVDVDVARRDVLEFVAALEGERAVIRR